ncbi:hypothetical protein NQZ68_030540 [Dissostichus eleginoides]|nr:hypothetical protein NQZ68_030540 [Dissostichus eleginoides]
MAAKQQTAAAIKVQSIICLLARFGFEQRQLTSLPNVLFSVIVGHLEEWVLGGGGYKRPPQHQLPMDASPHPPAPLKRNVSQFENQPSSQNQQLSIRQKSGRRAEEQIVLLFISERQQLLLRHLELSLHFITAQSTKPLNPQNILDLVQMGQQV